VSGKIVWTLLSLPKNAMCPDVDEKAVLGTRGVPARVGDEKSSNGVPTPQPGAYSHALRVADRFFSLDQNCKKHHLTFLQS
jgi:hypothetical protein